MAWYSVFPTLIVMASFPFFIAISACLTPVFRLRLDEKFNQGRREPVLSR
jgi:subfamily B ATP-binding cassette protein HlyB/CyaB